MGIGDTGYGLLKAILDVIYEEGQTETYDTDIITEKLKAKQWWLSGEVKTPERTVNSYFSQNQLIFDHIGANRYRLRQEYHKPTQTAEDVSGDDSAVQEMPIAAQAVSAFQDEVDELRTENAMLKAEIASLKQRLKSIAAICKEDIEQEPERDK